MRFTRFLIGLAAMLAAGTAAAQNDTPSETDIYDGPYIVGSFQDAYWTANRAKEGEYDSAHGFYVFTVTFGSKADFFFVSHRGRVATDWDNTEPIYAPAAAKTEIQQNTWSEYETYDTHQGATWSVVGYDRAENPYKVLFNPTTHEVYVTQHDVITGVEQVTPDGVKRFTAYNLQGMKVAEVNDADALRSVLAPGIYIVGGSKVLVR